MNESNHTIESTQQDTARLGDRHEDGSHLADQIIQAIQSDREIAPVDDETASSDGSNADSLQQISQDVDQFARGWIGRGRKLLQRSSQLVERETMLAGAIARLNQQQSEWSKRTSDKDAEIKEHSARLTEAWLEVEAARRKAIQGARAAATGRKLPPRPGGVVGPVVPVQPEGAVAPVANPVVATHPVVPGEEADHPLTASNSGVPLSQTLPQPVVPAPVVPSTVAAHGQVAPQPVNVQYAPQSGLPTAVPLGPPAGLPQPSNSSHPQQNVQGSPVATGFPAPISSTASESSTDPEQAQQLIEAAKQKKIEEFQRMQRALRSTQNK